MIYDNFVNSVRCSSLLPRMCPTFKLLLMQQQTKLELELIVSIPSISRCYRK